MNNKSEDIAMSDMAKTLHSIDQREQFKIAYDYITNIKKKEREKRNEPINIKDKTIYLGDLMYHFANQEAETKLKFALGWTTICFIKQFQNKFEFELSDEDTSKIIQKILSDM